MKSNHRTHLLFIEPANPPTTLPVEDELTEKVDFIFSQLVVGEGMYRGWHTTPFGVMSDYYDYVHPIFPLVSNSLAPYYIRHHRADISPKQLAWIEELYRITKEPANYYQFEEKPVYYFKLYEKSENGYGDVCTHVVKAIATERGVQNILMNTFFRTLTQQVFEVEIKNPHTAFTIEIDGCISVEAYDVLKDDLRKQNIVISTDEKAIGIDSGFDE